MTLQTAKVVAISHGHDLGQVLVRGRKPKKFVPVNFCQINYRTDCSWDDGKRREKNRRADKSCVVF